MAKVVKVIELLSESPKSWEDAAPKRSQRSEQDAAQCSLALRQGDDRCGRKWTDHELPAQFKGEFGIGRRSQRQKIISHQFVRENAEAIDRGCFNAEDNRSERDRQTAVGFGQA